MLNIGLDVGNGSTCVVVKNGNEPQVSKFYSSTYGIFDSGKIQNVLNTSDHEPQLDVYTLNQRNYVLGYKNVKAAGSVPISTYGREERMRMKSFQTLTRLALLDAATCTGLSGVIEVALCFGVPNEDYVKAKVSEVSKWFAEPITGTKNGQQIVVMVKNIEIVSQPIAVLFDDYYDNDGYVKNESIANEKTLVIDSGSGTLDMTEFDGTILRKQVSENIGMNDVYQTIIESIEKIEPKVRATPYDLEFQLRKQDGKQEFSYTYGSLSIPITQAYLQATEDVWEDMVGRIERRYPDRTRFNRVLLAGGTGDAFSGRFHEWMPQIQKTEQPQLAIARGLCKHITSFVGALSADE